MKQSITFFMWDKCEKIDSDNGFLILATFFQRDPHFSNVEKIWPHIKKTWSNVEKIGNDTGPVAGLNPFPSIMFYVISRV